MVTSSGPKLLEYNVRLGDPETQAVLPLMESDFASLCEAIIDGKLDSFNLSWKPGYVCAPVAVSRGYPGSYPKGLPIAIDEPSVSAAGGKIFIAGGTVNAARPAPVQGKLPPNRASWSPRAGECSLPRPSAPRSTRPANGRTAPWNRSASTGCSSAATSACPAPPFPAICPDRRKSDNIGFQQIRRGSYAERATSHRAGRSDAGGAR